MAIEEITRRIEGFIIEDPEGIRKILLTTPPRIYCLMAIVKMTRIDLTSGKHHFLSGFYVHSPLDSFGVSKMEIFEIAMKELEKAGICTEEVRLLRTRELREDIYHAG